MPIDYWRDIILGVAQQASIPKSMRLIGQVRG